MEEAASRLLYDQTIRVLDRHTVILSELRTRASILLSATGIVTALLGSAALGRNLAWEAVGCAVLITLAGLACSVIVLLPVHDNPPAKPNLTSVGWSYWRRLLAHIRHRNTDPRQWQVTLSPTQFSGLKVDASAGTPIGELLQKIVRELNPVRSTNYKTIEMLTKTLTAGAFLLVAQILCWTALLFFFRTPAH